MRRKSIWCQLHTIRANARRRSTSSLHSAHYDAAHTRMELPMSARLARSPVADTGVSPVGTGLSPSPMVRRYECSRWA